MNRFPLHLKTICALGGFALLLALVVWLRCWDRSEVFVAGRTFYVDPDCYSRMTRVQRVLEHPCTPVHTHEFENWPEGTRPHTTAPFDYLTAALAAALRGAAPDGRIALDWAGAWVSPLLAGLTAAALWVRAGRYRVATVLLFAVSPILVHGTALGRPDHQSLLLFCMAVALRAETVLLERTSRRWAVAGGLAWGLGLWVSLYEPLILLALAACFGAVAGGRAWVLQERKIWAGALGSVMLAGLAVDGWTISRPDPAVMAYFAHWSQTIGELSRTPLGTLAAWAGWLLFAAPLVLAWVVLQKRDARAGFWLGMLLVLGGLTLWQARWGYFLALGLAIALPLVLSAVRRGWLAWFAFSLALWPVAREWDRMLDRREGPLAQERRADNLALYEAAMWLRGEERRLPVLAPWWQSPALAYWSGQPCIAGSSHESLPGTVETSRFYLTQPGTTAGEAILSKRQAACVVAYEPSRVEAVSAMILGQSPEASGTLARWLYEHPSSPPPFLKLAYSNAAFRLYLRR